MTSYPENSADQSSLLDTTIRKTTFWLTNQALPFWAEHVLDPKGGYYECLSHSGVPVKGATRRVRVQARLIYAFSHAASLGWADDAAPFCRHGMDYMLTKGLQGGEQFDDTPFAGCAYSLDYQSQLVDGRRDTYTHAFFLLACLWHYKAFNDPSSHRLADQITGFLEDHLKASNGGWFEGVPAGLPRRQNPHMHLFETFLTAHSITGEERYLSLADHIFELFEKAFFDEVNGVVREFFTDDWTLDPEKGDLVEPGHMMEWCWLLSLYEKTTSRNLGPYQRTLYQRAVEIGGHPETGFLINKVNIRTGERDLRARSWPQTEYVKACLTVPHLPKEVAAATANRLLQQMHVTYLATAVDGGWYDQCDASGRCETGDMQSSSLYHWLGMVATLDAYRTDTITSNQHSV